MCALNPTCSEMEVVKEIFISTDDSDCYFNFENSFHIKLDGLSRFVNTSKRPLYVGLSKVTMPKMRRRLCFKLFHGRIKKTASEKQDGEKPENDPKKQNTVREPEASGTNGASAESTEANEKNVAEPHVMKEVTIDFSSFEEFCSLFELEANKMTTSKMCLETLDGHAAHVCHMAHDKYYLSLTYENNRFYMKLAPYHYCKISLNCAEFLGFANDPSSQEISFDGYLCVGQPRFWLSPENSKCHFLFENLFPCATTFRGCTYYSLGSYNLEFGSMVTESPFGLKRVGNVVGPEYMFSIVNNSFEPYVFEPLSVAKHISFLLTFYSPL